jgi:hypothetical protein
MQNLEARSPAVKELARRALARKRLKYFIPYVFPKYRIFPHNQLIADAVDLAIKGLYKRLMVFVPPQYGKSEIVSRKTPPFVLGNYPNKKLIMVSYGQDLANMFSRDSRDLIGSKLYQQLFGETANRETSIQLTKDHKSVKNWGISNYRGGVYAAGITGGISGHSADFAIIDDPVKDEEEAQSLLKRDKNWDWYWSSLYSRLSPDAPIILCMTRWHEDDLAGRLLQSQDKSGDKWYVLRLPAMAETPAEIAEWCETNFVTHDYWLTRTKVDTDYENARITN